MHDYLTIRSNGFVTYCDGLIASIEADQARAYLLSLVGNPAQIQATARLVGHHYLDFPHRIRYPGRLGTHAGQRQERHPEAQENLQTKTRLSFDHQH